MINYFICFISFLFLLSGCKHKENFSAPGYIEGKYTYISATYGGILQSLFVTPGNIIKKNQPLFALESLPEHAELEVALAGVKEAENQKKKAEVFYQLQKMNINRKSILAKQGVITKEELEAQQSTYKQAYADLQAAEENLTAKKANQKKLTWITQQKIVNAPFSSLVFNTYYTEGEYIVTGNPILSLLMPSEIKVIFYTPEPYLSKLKLNQVVDVFCDGCQSSFKAKIIYISPEAEFTPPVIYSTEEKAKLVYRYEALPEVSDVLTKLHPGQPVTVKEVNSLT